MTHLHPPSPEALLQHSAFVRAVARATLRSEDLVDDVEQETWVAALVGGARRRGPLRAWLGGVARRRAADLVRRETAQRSRSRKAMPRPSSPSASDVAERAELGRMLANAVLALEEPYRTAVLLRYYDGLPPREMASRLGIPAATVRTRVRRGLARLRSRMESESPAGRRGALAVLVHLAADPSGTEGAPAAPTLGGGLLLKTMVPAALLLVLGAFTAFVLSGGFASDDAEDHARPEFVADRMEAAAPPRLTGRGVEPAVVDASVEDGSVRGLIVDARGRPIQDATVSLADASVISTSDGAFVLPPPIWSATGEGGTVLASRTGYGTAQLPLRRPHTRELRIVLPPAAAIHGEVLSPQGPLAGVRVLLRDGAWERAVTTNVEGGFSFPEARTGRCELVALAEGYAPGGARISPGLEPRRVRIWLEPAATVRVRVVDRRGEPVAGARLAVRWGRYRDRLEFTVRTDRDGRGPPLPRSEHRGGVVDVSAYGFAGGGLTLPIKEDDDAVVVLRREVQVEVRAAGGVASADNRAWSFALGTNDREESAGPHFPVRRRASVGIVREGPWVPFDPQGSAQLPGARVGAAYTVVAARRDERGNPASYRTIIWRTDRLQSGPHVVEWTPPTLTLVRIRTTDEKTGLGVTSRIGLTADAATFSPHESVVPNHTMREEIGIRTSPEGESEAWLWPGRYTLSATGGAISTSGDVRIDGNVLEVGEEPLDVELQLPHGSVVRGRLRTADGVPLAGRQVILLGDAGTGGHRYFFSATTDDAGYFEVLQVPDGAYSVSHEGIRGAHAEYVSVRVEVPTGLIDLVEEGCAIRGEIRPVPAEPTRIALRPARDDAAWNPEWLIVELDEGGAFEMSGLSAGQWILQVRTVRGQTVTQRAITVADGNYVAVRLHRTTGRVLNADGSPLASSYLWFTSTNGDKRVYVGTDRNGAFETDALDAESYEAKLDPAPGHDGALSYGTVVGGEKDVVLSAR